MPFIKLKVLLLSIVSSAIVMHTAFASEKKEESAAATEEVPKDQKEFTDKTAKLTTLGNRIEEAEKRFQELVREKAAAKSPEAKQVLIKEMVEITNQRNKDADEFNKIKSDLTYRYPYQGEKLNRRYQTQSSRSLEEMEAAGGLDELLTRTKKVVERKFAPFMEEEKKPEPKPKVAKPGEEKPPRLRLEK
ncbi:MAG: hypothetical protein KF799_01465 [Bdellovibrionales bacterium]|nr:hypothetical protein [Bdellovibrionales bacterium]